MKFSHAIRNVPPRPGFQPFVYSRPTDLYGDPEGLSSGGLWYDPDSPTWVWKPLLRLVAEPEPHFETSDELPLFQFAAMLHLATFPVNWNSVMARGHLWLIRERGEQHLLTRDGMPMIHLDDTRMVVEQDIRALNAHGWKVGPFHTLLDQDFTLMIGGTSRATYDPTAKDEDRAGINRWLRFSGAAYLAAIRDEAMEIREQGYPHVYLAASRPQFFYPHEMDRGFGREISSQSVGREIQKGGVYGHNWVCTTLPLSKQCLEQYELTWGWSPLEEV